MDWDDYRYFSALAQNGSVRGAAKQLAVNPSTVTRRLEHLEDDLGVALFIRTGRAMKITTEGVEVAQRVDEISRQFRLLHASVKGKDKKLAGDIRISVPDILANSFLLGDLARFLDMYEEIELTVVPSYQPVNDELDVDVRLSVTDDPPEWMVGRRLGRIGLAAYASKSAEKDSDTWVSWATSPALLARYTELRHEYFAHTSRVLKCDQVEMQRSALRAGMGIGILPVFVGDADPDLARLEIMPVQESPSLWVLTHPNARSTRRIQVFLEYLREIFVNHQEEVFV